MKKKLPDGQWLRKIARGQFLFTMKLSLTLCFFAVLSASANVNVLSQNVDLDFDNASLHEVFRSLREQTGQVITYSLSKVEVDNTRVTIKRKNIPLSRALDEILDGLPYAYSIGDGEILIMPSPERQPPAQVTISGTVTDTDGQPLAGVTVSLAGTKYGTATDANGQFSFRAPQGDNMILRFSYVGKKDAEVRYTGQGDITVGLEGETSRIDQVVVTGYQTIAREKVTGAVSTITAEELAGRYTPNLLNNLEGRVPGLIALNGKIQIRGTGSIYANLNPLLVIDGMPVEGEMADINPYDIESVTVLKDAAAAAIYGARASNGIIVVTTKRARGTGRVEVDVAANFTVYEKQNLDYHDNFFMNPKEQVDMEMKTWQNYFFDDATTSGNAISATEAKIAQGFHALVTPVCYAYYQLAKGDITREDFDGLMKKYKSNNFAKEYSDNILKKRLLQQYNVAIRSGGGNFNSNLVLNYRRDNTGMIKASNNRFNVFYKGGYDLTKWFTLNFGAEMGFEKSKKTNSPYALSPFSVPSYMNLFDDKGNYNYYSTLLSNIYHTQWKDEPGLKFNGFNHLEEIESGHDRTVTKRMDARLQTEFVFRLMDGLTVNTMFVYEADRINKSSYAHEDSYLMRMMRNAYTEKSPAGVYTYLIPENGGKLATNDKQSDHWTARGQLNFNRTLARKHSVNFLAGLEFRQTLAKGTDGLLMGYSDQLQSHSTLSVNYLNLGKVEYAPFYGLRYPVKTNFYVPSIERAVGPDQEKMHRYASGYANLTYTYDNRYNFFASYRSDYADVYGLDTKFRGKPLWSVGASWNVNREGFMKNAAWIDVLKLRLSYGVTGNIYQGVTSRLTARTDMKNTLTGQPVALIQNPANPLLKWEQTATTNIGADINLFRHRIRATVDWYKKKGSDIFANKQLEDSKGFTSMPMNAACLENTGIEFSLGVDWFRAHDPKGFSWTTSATFAYNRNKITKVETPAHTALELIFVPYKEGYPVNALFSCRYAGISEDGTEYLYWKGDPAGLTEDVKVNTVWNNGPDIPAIIVFSGQSDPKYSAGMENRFGYRNFSLNVTMVYYGGHKMRMRRINMAQKNSLPYGTIDVAYVDSWTPENKDTNVPGYGRYGGKGASSEYSAMDLFVHSGDYLKIRNIVLGYSVPHAVLSKLGLSRAVLNFQIDNPKPLHIANKHGVDPETGGLRRQTSYIFGLNIGF